MGLIKGYHQSTAIRKSYQILPFQGVWSWLTGKELPDRKPLWQSTSTELTAWSLIWTAAGIFFTSLAVYSSWPLLARLLCYLLGALFSTSGARYIVATIIHHGVHGHLYKSQSVNRVLCEILSTLLIVQPYDSYRQFHVYEHHGREFSTLEDKDLAAIYQLGFRPGTPKRDLYTRLVGTLLSPKFHLFFFWGRLKANTVGVPAYRLAMSLVWWLVLAVLMSQMGIAASVAILLLPFVIFYQIASLLHLLTEHIWLVRKEGESVRDSHINNCLARFCGEMCPESFALRNSARWGKWLLMHLFVHLPTRMLIVQGSLVCHDWHHRYGNVRQWYDYAQLREKHAYKLYSEDSYDYFDIWGIHNALDYVFKALSESDEIEMTQLEYRLN